MEVQVSMVTSNDPVGNSKTKNEYTPSPSQNSHSNDSVVFGQLIVLGYVQLLCNRLLVPVEW